MFYLDERGVYRAESLERFAWLEHGFGTRASMAWPDPSRLVTPKQIHSSRVLVIPPGVPAGRAVRLGEGDALISLQAGVLAGIRTADCLPILVVDAETRMCAAIHAGWRGTAAGIAVEAIREMVQFGARPEDIWVAIGPGIGRCCFEVGPEVGAQFQAFFPERADLNHQAAKTTIDLAEANRRQFIGAGVPKGHIEMSGLCTACRGAEFYSYRRERERAGRMISAIGRVS